MKICNLCHKSLALSAFRAHPMAADKLQGKCKECTTAYDRVRYQATREKQIANARAWNLANPDRVRANMRTADSKRRAYKNASRKQYDERIKQATSGWADLEQIQMFYEVSEVLSRTGLAFEVDHIAPIRGVDVSGLHNESNLRVITQFNNRAKNNRLTVDLSELDICPTINLVEQYAIHI